MSGISMRMRKEKKSELREIVSRLKRELTVENTALVTPEVVCEHWRESEGMKACLLAFERYYFRNGSYATLSIMFTETENEQTADIAGSGGGEGLLNISWGANQNFANLGIDALEEMGFRREL